MAKDLNNWNRARHEDGNALYNFAAVASGAGLTAPVAPNAFTQLAADDTIELISSAAGDTTQKATLVGISTSNTLLVTSAVKLNGTTAVDVTGYRYIENVFLDSPCAGTVTIRRETGPATIATITIGQLSTSVVHMFCYQSTEAVRGRIYGWGARIRGAAHINAQLFYFPDVTKARGLATGMLILGDIVTNALDPGHEIIFPAVPTLETTGGYIAVVAANVVGAAPFSAWMASARI